MLFLRCTQNGHEPEVWLTICLYFLTALHSGRNNFMTWTVMLCSKFLRDESKKLIVMMTYNWVLLSNFDYMVAANYFMACTPLFFPRCAQKGNRPIHFLPTCPWVLFIKCIGDSCWNIFLGHALWCYPKFPPESSRECLWWETPGC